MLLVVTDTGRIWNHENPFLEKYKDIVLVVCLKGKKATDKYKCLIPSFKDPEIEMNEFGLEDKKFRALYSARKKLLKKFESDENIVFLTDGEPSSLYPYFIVRKELIGDRRLYYDIHLVAAAPLDFESNSKIKHYYNMLSDLSLINSVLYYDTNKVFKGFDKSKNLNDFYDYVRDDLGKIMHSFLSKIYYTDDSWKYFDFASMKYVRVNEGFEGIDFSKEEDDDFPTKRRKSEKGSFLMGIMAELPGGEEELTLEKIQNSIRSKVETCARIDGKKVCNVLREQRIRLAEANNIPFESEECPSTGPCAGTCPKCDKEADYLRQCMKKIPEERRVYPQFDPAEEV